MKLNDLKILLDIYLIIFIIKYLNRHVKNRKLGEFSLLSSIMLNKIGNFEFYGLNIS